ELANDLEIGAGVLDRAMALVADGSARLVRSAASSLRDEARSLEEREQPAPDLADPLWGCPVRDLGTAAAASQLWVGRQRAPVPPWYEMFPRSEGATIDRDALPVQHGTFRTAAARLPAIAAMGFDVVYLPPIHPIGQVHRKGRNNALVARPGDV